MKTIIFTLTSIILSALIAQADVSVRGYVRNDGTYVAPYHRTAPDSNPYNNYEYMGSPYKYGR